jgi:hypothetical protein
LIKTLQLKLIEFVISASFEFTWKIALELPRVWSLHVNIKSVVCSSSKLSP